jgi:hypothetical protein
LIPLLLEAGANVNVISARMLGNKYGHSPLSVACIWNPDSIEPLLKAGANIHLVDEKGWTPLHCLYRHYPSMVPLLLKYGADPTIRDLEGKLPHEVARDHPYVSTEIGPCVICLENQRTIVLIPCGHAVLCHTCNTVETCPICRGNITDRVNLYL